MQHMCLAKYKKYEPYAPLVLRLFAGIIFVYAGWGKLNGGIAGFSQALTFLPSPLFWAWLVTLVEFIGGIGLILGLFVRWASIPLSITMLVATIMMFKTQGMMGVTAPFWGLAMCIVLFFTGAGKYYNLEKQWFKKEF